MNPLAWSTANVLRIFKQCMTDYDGMSCTSVHTFAGRLIKRKMITRAVDVNRALDLLLKTNKIFAHSSIPGLYLLPMTGPRLIPYHNLLGNPLLNHYASS